MLVTIEDFYEKNYSMLDNIPQDIANEDWYKSIKDIIDNCIDNDFYNYQFNNRILRKGCDNTEVEQVDLIHKNVKFTLIRNNYKYKTLFNTTNLEYNPIWNVDGTEERVRESSKESSDTDTYNNTDTLTKSGSDTLSLNGTDTETKSVTTYDSNVFRDTEKKIDNPNTTDTTTYNSSDTNKHTGTVSNAYEDSESETETVTKQGNIGITSTQSLISQERQVALFDFISIVEKDIIKNVCSLIY